MSLPALAYAQPEPGNYFQRLLRPYLSPGLTIYEIGGDHPCVDMALKRELRLHIIALDARRRLPQTPLGLYDTIICADALEYRGRGDGDIVLWQGVPEDIADQNRLFEALVALIKPGGLVVLHSASSDRQVHRRLRELAAVHGLMVVDQERHGRGLAWIRGLAHLGSGLRKTLAPERGISIALRTGMRSLGLPHKLSREPEDALGVDPSVAGV